MKLITKLSIAGASSILVGVTIITSFAISNLPQKQSDKPNVSTNQIKDVVELPEQPVELDSNQINLTDNSNQETPPVEKVVQQPVTPPSNNQQFCNGANCLNHDADGDGICDITGQPVGNGNRNRNGYGKHSGGGHNKENRQ